MNCTITAHCANCIFFNAGWFYHFCCYWYDKSRADMPTLLLLLDHHHCWYDNFKLSVTFLVQLLSPYYFCSLRCCHFHYWPYHYSDGLLSFIFLLLLCLIVAFLLWYSLFHAFAVTVAVTPLLLLLILGGQLLIAAFQPCQCMPLQCKAISVTFTCYCVMLLPTDSPYCLHVCCCFFHCILIIGFC